MSTTKNYYIEAKLSKNHWTLLHTTRRQDEALEYVHDHAEANAKYPMRIVRVTRKIVFDGSQK
jgi:hypothetical protein